MSEAREAITVYLTNVSKYLIDRNIPVLLYSASRKSLPVFSFDLPRLRIMLASLAFLITAVTEITEPEM
jgi:hypothetical protein